MQIFFMSIGLLISVILPKVKSPLSLSLGITIGLYVLGALTDDKIRFLIPFKYFNGKDLLLDGLNIKYILLSIIIIISFLLIAYNKYKKRDLYV